MGLDMYVEEVKFNNEFNISKDKFIDNYEIDKYKYAREVIKILGVDTYREDVVKHLTELKGSYLRIKDEYLNQNNFTNFYGGRRWLYINDDDEFIDETAKEKFTEEVNGFINSLDEDINKVKTYNEDDLLKYTLVDINNEYIESEDVDKYININIDNKYLERYFNPFEVTVSDVMYWRKNYEVNQMMSDAFNRVIRNCESYLLDREVVKNFISLVEDKKDSILVILDDIVEKDDKNSYSDLLGIKESLELWQSQIDKFKRLDFENKNYIYYIWY